MVDLVTLEEAKAALRVTFADDDAHIQLLVSAASQSILDYLKKNGWSDFYDGTTLTGAVPMNVKAATLIWVDMLFSEVSIEDAKLFSHIGNPPHRVASLLHMRRDPALA